MKALTKCITEVIGWSLGALAMAGAMLTFMILGSSLMQSISDIDWSGIWMAIVDLFL